MGVLSWLGVGKRTGDLLKSSAIDLGITSPWAEGNLSSIVYTDILGVDDLNTMPMTRAEAITLPAVSKARNLLISTIGKFPLVVLNKDGPLAEQPAWLYRTDGNVTPYERIAWTVDDLIFYGYSLWRVVRGADTKILDAAYVPMIEWKITDGHILIDDQEVDESEVILFNSPFEGLLNIGSRTLRGARDQELAWTARVRNPIPMTVLKDKNEEGQGLTADEIKEVLTQWGTARRDLDGALGYLPPGLELETHGEADPALFIGGRNASRTDIGSFLNIPVAMLDGTIGVDSLTYSTTDGNRNRFYDESIPFWTDPIEARLSMDDVVPRGQRVRFDKTEAYAVLPNPTDAPTED